MGIKKSKTIFIEYLADKFTLCEGLKFHQLLNEIFSFIDSDPDIRNKFGKAFPKSETKLSLRDKRLLKQAISKGWSDDETWSLRDNIAKFVLPRLKRYREIDAVYPVGLENKEWNDIVDKMIRAFEIIKSDKITDKNYEEVKDGLELFSTYFLCLWW